MTSVATLKSVRWIGRRVVFFHALWLNAPAAAMISVWSRPSTISETKSTAYDTDIDDTFCVDTSVVSGSEIFIAALAQDSTNSAANSHGCSNRIPGVSAHRMTAANPMTAVTYRRAARVSCFTRLHHDEGRGSLARASWRIPGHCLSKASANLSECATPGRAGLIEAATRAETAHVRRIGTRDERFGPVPDFPPM